MSNRPSIRVVKFVALPRYAHNDVTVLWSIVLPDYASAAKVHILRSVTSGNTPWTPVTSGNGLQASVESIQDTLPDNAFELTPAELYYKIVVTYTDTADGVSKRFIGPQVGVYGILSPREMKITRSLLLAELRGMYSNRRGAMAGHGRLVVMFAPSIDGPASSKFDQGASQMHGDSEFGMPNGFIGGWSTWLRMTKNTRGFQDLAETGSEIQNNTLTARMLAFPQPKPDYVVVDPHTDERWVVNETESYYGPRGIVPVATDLQLTKLLTSDLRYKIPVEMPVYPVFKT
jgi:hypothetical protein